MSNPIFTALSDHAHEGTLTASILLDQMVEDRKTADSYDPNDYESRIEAHAAWWCLQEKNRRHLLNLPKEQQEQVARAILTESAWGHLYSRDFQPDVFDYLAELSSQRDVLMSGVAIAGKNGWIEWALAHFEKTKVRAIIFHCLQEQPEAAKAFFGSIGSGWSHAFWRLFDTVPLFEAAIKAVTPHVPSRVISCWSHIGAYLTKVGNGHTLEKTTKPWKFLPNESKDVRKLANPSMKKVQDLLLGAFKTLKPGEYIHARTLRHFPIDFRLTALEYVQRLDEGIELSVDLLFALRKEDKRSDAVLKGFLSRMTPKNAPLVYIHALACKMDKKPGDLAYTRTKKTRGGRHHASRGQRGIWDDRIENEQKELLKSRVRKAWFYPQLRARLIECGWEFISADLKNRVYDGPNASFGTRYVYDIPWEGQTATMVLRYLPLPALSGDSLQWLHLQAKYELIVPTRPWRKPDEVDNRHPSIGTFLTFHSLLPIFDAPMRMSLFEMREQEAMEAKKREQERHQNRRHHRRF